MSIQQDVVVDRQAPGPTEGAGGGKIPIPPVAVMPEEPDKEPLGRDVVWQCALTIRTSWAVSICRPPRRRPSGPVKSSPARSHHRANLVPSVEVAHETARDHGHPRRLVVAGATLRSHSGGAAMTGPIESQTDR